MVCHVCKNDPELFGDGIFYRGKKDVVQGVVPCGCSKRVCWSEKQYSILVSRVCKTLGYVFKEFSGDYCGSATRLDLVCNGGHNWQTTSINSLLKIGVRCPECAYAARAEGNRKSEEIIIRSFHDSGAFSAESTFWKSSRKTRRGTLSFWWYRCPICAEDEYTRGGLCTGEFESFAGDLQKGRIPCRCSGRFRWTVGQREYQIHKELKSRTTETFAGWKTSYKNSWSRISVLCSLHGEYESNVSQVVYNRCGCPNCAKSGYQYLSNSHVYVLLCHSRSDSFTGYGISGDIKTRLTTHEHSLRERGYIITSQELFSLDGYLAFDIEKLLKSTFVRYPQTVEGFKKEATYGYLYPSVIQFINETILNKT